MRSRMFITSALGVALLLAGCGGDDAPTKAEYITKADAICKKGDAASQKDAQAKLSALGSSPTKEQVASVVSEIVLPNIESQLKELRALDKPKGDGDTIDAIYDDLDAGLKRAKADPAATVASTTSPFADATAKARAYGMKDCGSDG